MAETSKLLNPDKLVLIPDRRAGCSLAASITGADVRLLRERYPGVPIVTYVNTSADVKAESDICCTSSNAVEVVESLGADRVIFLPDQFLAKWVASQTKVKIIAWHGACEVHERFTGTEIRDYREAHRACGPRPSRMSAGCHRGGRLHRIDGEDDRLGEDEPSGPRASRHRMLDGLEHRSRGAGHRVHPAVQPLPAHEADHIAEDPRQPRLSRRTK